MHPNLRPTSRDENKIEAILPPESGHAAYFQIVAALAREAPVAPRDIPRVIWRDAGGTVRAVEVTRALTVGRASGCAVEISHPSVSAVHALLGPEKESFWIVDLSSAAGTTVNGVRVGEVLSPLKGGDVIELGGVPLAFVHQAGG
jgi:pSer/pThr/pTyr-binding forkhead associated (FHA) protein